MKINIKKLNEKAVIPQYATDGSAAMDVTAVSMEVTDKYIEYDTGLAFEIPKGYVMLIFPRSSVSKYDLSLANAVGVLDSDYRGPLKLRFKRNYLAKTTDDLVYDIFHFDHESCILDSSTRYKVGDRIGQIMIIPYPEIEFNEVDKLSETERGDGGFGSTNK